MTYIIADEPSSLWEHIFDEDGKQVKRNCRFAYDIRSETIVSAFVLVDGEWVEGGHSVRWELEDSLRNANPGALDEPADFGLVEVGEDDLPEWAHHPVAPSP